MILFRGQALTRTVSFDILGATSGIAASVDRPVLPATGNLETVNVTFGPTGGGKGQTGATPTIFLQQVQIFPNPTLARSSNVVIGANGTQLQLKAAAGLTYVLLYRVHDPTTIRRTYIRLAVLVSSRKSFETPTPTKL
jgi:hypothetical protein